MIKLNKALLMLSRIENNQFDATQTVDFNSVIHEACEELADLIEFRGITLEVLEHGKFSADFNMDLVKILISNLLRNAINYNKSKNGFIKIDIHKDFFTIANSGKNTALQAENIFDRFHKENTAVNSNGLGLSIVKTIIETNKTISINYSYLNNFHIFKIQKL
ncbi:sensor histidine kinase [Sphingobacterium sp. IITKGP-BTPF85]|uniref:sensor histidine kinase n=1 Tax=Sphingobacterium sp. IITKGP-BTPF85 TaxID=1338009 RepID=UPI0003F5B00A|nr:HAMP domain-containing sensor histidine kinase [Sphingobacterium sp. IITKGP-BTPF85]